MRWRRAWKTHASTVYQGKGGPTAEMCAIRTKVFILCADHADSTMGIVPTYISDSYL